MFLDFSPICGVALKTGISKFWKTNTSELIIPKMIRPFSYISCDENKLLYTSDTETVNCCDMNGKPIWSFQNTAVLRSPRGVVVDNEGFVANFFLIIFYLQLLIYNKSQVDDLHIFVQDLILFQTRIPSFLCYTQVFYSHFYHSTLLLGLKCNIPPLMNFHLLYTSDTETVNCCDMNGKPIWSFQNTAVLRSPRGVVVDNEGFVFVAGEKSKNIVAISPDGNSSKEVYYISSPRAMCYE
jgi:outer membrane protein assembly factor BamB